MFEVVDKLLPLMFALTIGFFWGQSYAFKKLKGRDENVR